jgi:type IV secretion system protein VirB4
MMQANAALKRLHGPWTLHAEAQHVPFTSYPHRTARFPVPGMIDSAWERTLCTEDAGVWETRYFLALTWEPPQGQKRARLLFLQAADAFMEHLQPVLAEMEPLTGEALLATLKTTVSLRWTPVAWPERGTDLSRYLVDSAWDPGQYPDWDARLGTQHIRVLTLTGYPRRSWAGMMQRLEALALPFRWSKRWNGIQPHQQDALLTERQKDWLSREKTLYQRGKEHTTGEDERIINEDATRKTEELGEVRQDVGAGLIGIGASCTTLITWAEDADTAEERAGRMRHACESLGFVIRREGDYGARTPMGNWVLQWLAPPHHGPAFRAAMPGNTTDNVLKSLESTIIASHLLPGMRATWPGPGQDDHLKQGPWFVARTESSAVVRVVHHVRDVGHALLLGNTGTGKSTFVGFGMAQWLMYRNTQGTIFDVGRTARLLTLLCGGEWIDFGNNAVPLQPLRDVHEPSELRWCLEWLLGICARAKVDVSGVTQAYLKARLEALAELPVDARTFTGLVQICALHNTRVEGRVTSGVGTRDASGISRPNAYRMKRLELYRDIERALRPFARGGEYGGILDGVQDHLLDAHLVVFEHMGLVKTPRLLEAVAQYGFHLTERRFDTRHPMWLVLEEAPLLAVMPTYKEQFDAWLMTIRKAGASLALVVNSLEQAATMGLRLLTSENTPTRWYFPNVEALTPQTGKVYDLFGLTQEEKRLIATARPYRDIYYVARERGRRLVQLSLSPFILDCVARNTDEDHELMDKLLAQSGKAGFPAAWLNHHGYEKETVWDGQHSGGLDSY